MPARKGLLAPQNTFLDTIANRFDGTHSNFVLGNAKVANIYPIVYCSDGFCDLTGYSRAQIMQKSCACDFLYGPKTDFQHRQSITNALKVKQEFKLELILYKSSGTPFWCLLDIVPILDEKHEVVLFLCSHKDITKEKLHQHQQQLLAQLQVQKKLAVAAALTATGVATGTASDSGNQEQASEEIGGSNGAGESVAGSLPAPTAALNMDPGGDALRGCLQNKANNLIKADQNLEEADEADLEALANRKALLSMDEFDIQDNDLNTNDATGDFCDMNDNDSDDLHHDKTTTNQYSRRRSRAVLYQLSGHYGYGRRSVNMKSKLKLNNRMNIPEYKTTTIEKQRFILSHYGVGKTCWDWLILIVSFYVAIVVPYNATFKPIKELNNHPFGAEDQQPLRPNQTNECQIDLIDIFVEVVFVIDVILNFRTTFVNRKGEVVTRPKVICKHYIRGWFIVDACAALPFDLLCTLNIGNRSRLDLNLLKLIRLLRLARLLQKMDRYSQYSYIILTLLMLIFSLLAHWCACIWYVIASTEIERSPGRKINWLYQLSDKLNYSVVTEKDMVSSYVTALYFTTSSLTSVGFGNVSANTNAEKIFSIVIMLIGALMHAVVFGNVTALIRVMYARRSNYQTRLRDLKDFFRLHQLPKELKQRMSDYFQTTWSLNHGIETYEILKDFPEELRGDVSLHLHREVLSLPIFETAPQGFLKSLARHIESKFCCPTEYLIHRGDALNYLYLVCNGSMEVLQDNMVVAILGKGDLVGYDVNAGAGSNHQHFDSHHNLLSGSKSLLNANSASISHQHHHQRQHHHHHVGLLKSSSDLKALTYCDLKCIHISGLLEVMQFYPEFSDTFHREIIHDLSFNLREMHEEPEFADTDNETMEPQERKEKRKRKDLLGEQASSGQSSSDSDSNGSSLNSAPNGGRQTKRPAMLMPSSSMLRTRRGTNGAALFNRTINQADNEIGRYDHVEATPIERNQDELAEEDEEGAEEDEDRQSDSDDEDEEEDEDDDDDEEEEEAEDTDSTARNDEEDKGGGGGGDNGPSAGSGQTNNRSSREEAGDKQNSTTSKPDGPESAVGLHFGSQSAATERQSGLRNRRSKYDNWQSCDELKITRFRRQADDRVRGREEFDTMIIAANAISSEQRVLTETILAPSSGRKVKLAGAELRPAIQRHNAARKPPLSFDLSRNTTALVDRRRRSAGCIAASRPLLIGSQMGGAASVVARKNLQVKNKNFNRPTLMRHQFNTSLASSNSNQSTSSLTHINERDRPSCQLGSGGNRIRASKGPARSEAGNADCRGTLANALIGNDRSSLADLEITKETRFDSLRGNNNQAEVGHQTKLNTKQTSLEHYKRVQVIDDQSGAGQMIDKEMLANLSKSVNDMKSELKSELNQFRSTMQHLMQMLAIDRDRNEDDEDSNQIIRPVRIGCPTSGGHLRASKATSFSEIRLNQLIKTPSTSSLPIVKSRRRYFNEGNYNQHKVLWRRNQFRSIMEQQYKENSSSFSQNESLSNADNCENNSCLNFEQAAMEHCKNESKLSSCSKNPMPTSIGKPESDSTNADWLQTGIGTNLRPVSQCSTSTIILDSGQVGQAVCSAANVVSDQDSGRSSSSLNSSGLYCKQAENASFKDQSEVKNEIETSVSKTGRLAKISLRNDDEDNSYTIAIE